ncbi:MAG: glycosyltransferase [Lachnospiraceae bacterium]|nr:glycosyltransferase [Lachnospiraceae bacterium]
MKKMVYQMNVEWNWIKQRPHFIAEELSKRFDTTIVYQYRYNRKGLQQRETRGEKLLPVKVIPLIGRSRKLHQVNEAWVRSRFAKIIGKEDPDYVFITRPEMVGTVSKFKGRVIYDCMDDYYAFSGEEWLRRRTLRDEGALVKRADLIFASSAKLRESLIARYGKNTAERIHVVRNGFGGEILPPREDAGRREGKPFTLCYFGTIDTWFDFDLVLRSLEVFPEIEYLLAGPAKVPVPQHERIRYIGTVEHDRLGEATADADCYIMPFHVNEIIEAVDPVKLYEYINFDRNILCVRYKEVERFGDFVRFYTDEESYCGAIRSMLEDPAVPYGNAEREAFLRENGWSARADQMTALIEKL